MTLSELKLGEKAKVVSFNNKEIGLKLLEMGMLPGSIVALVRKAPFGCPYYVQLTDGNLSIRKSEANNVLIEPI